MVNDKLDVTDAEDETLEDVEDDGDDEDAALDFVVGALELAAAELDAEDVEADDELGYADRLGKMPELAIA